MASNLGYLSGYEADAGTFSQISCRVKDLKMQENCCHSYPSVDMKLQRGGLLPLISYGGHEAAKEWAAATHILLWT